VISSADTLPVHWSLRAQPLAPAAACATGAVAAKLVRRLLQRSDEALTRLRGVASPRLIALLGDEAELPWVDGVIYLGRDLDAPSLLMPTQRQPDVHPTLLERALLARFTDVPLALLIEPSACVPLGKARPLARISLEHWLASSIGSVS
jgi:hypothetical protein